MLPGSRIRKSRVRNSRDAQRGRQERPRARARVEGRGCQIPYLPPHPPDLDPIEEASFAKLKTLVRRAEARTRQALIEAMGRALAAATGRDARGFFEHRDYRASDRLL